jgi:hypothetical protein
MSSKINFVACVALCFCVPLALASTFLHRPPSQSATHATAALSRQAENALLKELEAALGSTQRHATEKRLKRIQQKMLPMFNSVTKNENGNLGSAAAGYLLHRLFVQRHGWFIRALEPSGNSLGAWNSSSPTAVLAERVPEHVQQLFEKRLGMHGMGLHEIAVLASTLEQLVHRETVERLTMALNALNLKPDQEISQEEASRVLEVYMANYILGFLHEDTAEASAEKVNMLHEEILDLYPAWPETQAFLNEVFQSVAPKRDYMYISEIENVAEEIGERYGRFQDVECRQLKDMLLAVEDKGIGGAGRVRVSDFYKLALHDGKWQFSESVDYLRTLGALDESDGLHPRVIIPNYLSGPSNCVASSKYYSVCCVDECEAILGRLEESVMAAEASPKVLADLISSISSATVLANRKLSPWLQQRLDEVAQHHNGMVPLHGRLFAQWLHFAYPRECPFPHVLGTISPQRPEDLLFQENMTEDQISANEEMMRQVIDSAPAPKIRTAGAEATALEESAMWSLHEELVVHKAAPLALPQAASQSAGHCGMIMFGAVVSGIVALMQSRSSTKLSNMATFTENKYYV